MKTNLGLFSDFSGKVFGFALFLLLPAAFAWPVGQAMAAAASCDPAKNLYSITSVGTSYDPFLGNTSFTYKISAVAGAKNISNYVISTPFCKDITAFKSNTSLAASCVSNEKFSGITGFKIDTPVPAPGSTTITVVMNGAYTTGAGTWGVKAGTCPDTKGTLSSVPVAKTTVGTLKFKETNPTVSETAGKVLVTVSRVGGSAGSLTVNYSTSDGTAVAGKEYTAVTGTLSWAAGDTTDKVIAIPVTNTKTFYEVAKTFTVTVKTTDNLYSIDNTVSIVSNPKVTVANTTYVVSSFAKVATVTLVRTKGVDPTETVTAVVNTADITAVAATDYVAVIDQTVTLAPGETLTAVPVTMIVAVQPPPTDRLFAVAVTETVAPFREAKTVVAIRGTATVANVAVTEPKDGDTLTAVTTVKLAATATITPKRYEAVVQNQVVATLDTTASTADLAWDTTTVADGTYTLHGQVTYDDINGNQTLEESDPITVVVANGQAAVQILTPKANAVVTGLVAVKFSVTAQSVSAELYVDNQLRVAAQPIPANSANFTIDYDSTADADGLHTLTVKVTDAGNQVTAASVDVNVSNPVADLNVTVKPDTIAALVNDQVAYTAHVINAGPSDAVATLTIPTLPNSTTLQASDPGNGCVIGANDVVCTLNIPGVSSTDVVLVKSYQAAGNYAEVLDVSGDVPDPNPGDNKTTFTAIIQ